MLNYSRCQEIRDINEDDVIQVIHLHLFGRNEKDGRMWWEPVSQGSLKPLPHKQMDLLTDNTHEISVYSNYRHHVNSVYCCTLTMILFSLPVLSAVRYFFRHKLQSSKHCTNKRSAAEFFLQSQPFAQIIRQLSIFYGSPRIHNRVNWWALS